MEEKIEKAVGIAKGIIQSRTKEDDIQKVTQSILNLAHVKSMNAGSDATDELEEEIVYVLGRVRSNLGATELQQITQAALHLMSARTMLATGKPRLKKQMAGT